ncbi:hypothetical protein [Agrococcus sp. HG114]|uniref:hypothetical protein n=1 Tax=Agrococcus sp. HG114 TaxID=2969757 RepID=UPI00215AEC7F|nr:hypothetical protein [Agrococcus sp. HG114]MCR8671818.1 hypothetical protein [Agrococcus sp. HG114]
MLEDLLAEAAADQREARPPRAVRDPRAARLGTLSLLLLIAALALQGISFAQQLSYLFAPRPGELPVLVVVLVMAILTSLAAVVVGCMAAMKPDGRRKGVFAAALALGFLVLFGAASWFGWGFLGALSAPI